MDRFRMGILLFFVAAAAGIAALFAFTSSRGRETVTFVVAPDAEDAAVAAATPAATGGPAPPSPPPAVALPAPSAPVSSASAPPPPSPPPPGLPRETVPEIRRLSAQDLERMSEEARRQAEEHVKAATRRELAMFEEFMGPIDEVTGARFLEVYYAYYEEASRALRRRVTEAVQRAEASGTDPVMPDKDEVFAEIRAKAYEKLETILDARQLETFRTWWEEKCHPGRTGGAGK